MIECTPHLVAGVCRAVADILSRGSWMIGPGYQRGDVFLGHVMYDGRQAGLHGLPVRLERGV
jgi:hypothetical protein